MGSGIAQQAAMSGCEVRLYDISSEKLNKALQDISLSLGRFASKGVIQNQEISGILGRIYSCTSIDAPVSYTHLDVYKRQNYNC